VNDRIRNHLRTLKRRISDRLNRSGRADEGPVLGSNITYEIANRARAVAAGGVGLMQQLVRAVGLDRQIDDRVELLKHHVPYHESDHVLAITYNILAGGTCLETLERRRTDEAFLDMLGARRLPDPTTAGDFCRRFESKEQIDALQSAINESRLKVWSQQPSNFFEHAVIDADGTIAETTGECKEGIDLSYKGIWGYQVLVVSLANTEEVLFQDLRPGSRPSHEGAADRLDQAVVLVRRAGFRKITLRGDTDFSQTVHLDRWHEDGVEFVFGYAAIPKLVEIAVSLDEAAWRPLDRRDRYTIKTAPRTRPENVKERIVRERELRNLYLVKEDVAEFDYRPCACSRDYRVVVVRKLITHERGQKLLFPEHRFFFYITNRRDLGAADVVQTANTRCNQERTIEQLKNGVHALRMPIDKLHANWAYTVMATLAWNLSRWLALALRESPRWAERHRDEKQQLLRMRFPTFLHALMLVPAQVVHGARRLTLRLLAWTSWQHVFFRALDGVRAIA
jgi:hypothetical protein